MFGALADAVKEKPSSSWAATGGLDGTQEASILVLAVLLSHLMQYSFHHEVFFVVLVRGIYRSMIQDYRR